MSLPNTTNDPHSLKTSLTLLLPTALTVLADTCDLRGWHQVEIVVGSGGPGQAPVAYTTQGFDLNYEGGVPIGSSKDLNPIAVDGITIPPGALGQPNEIQWDPQWDLTSFGGCSATYEGVTSPGAVASCSGGTLGTSCSQCTVKIPCEGNLV